MPETITDHDITNIPFADKEARTYYAASMPGRDAAASGRERSQARADTQHTPGPWAVAWNVRHLDGLDFIHGQAGVDEQPVAIVFTAATPEAEENARLLAAAPDLLAALKALYSTSLMSIHPDQRARVDRALVQATFAIDKADGR